ncbi:MAG TPA: hypothetical protein VNV86_02715 [Candidatus Acidoferrum sp.]|nr:hypothetical protein [Candidatus Acidoferrum sp.]
MFLTDFNFRPEASRGPIADAGKRIVAQISTRFGRLVFLCSLRDAATGRYSHPALTETFGVETADRALRHTHHQVFREWLRLSLGDQKEDLDEYLRISRIPPVDLRYRDLTPAGAHEVELQLYLTDLEVIVQLISFDPGSFCAPDALPPR